MFEDNAYKDLFISFDFSMQKQISLKPVCGGFKAVHLQLTSEQSIVLKELSSNFENAYVLALIDGDLDSQSESKIEQLKQDIPIKYKERIFVVGSKCEAEDIKQAIIGQGKWKTVSQKLENSCKNENCELWQDEMLKHNLDEIARLKKLLDWE